MPMLIEFSVKNFRSIKEKQTLSMVANTRDRSLEDHLIDTYTPSYSNTKLLKSAAIYGANASGKSNLYKAVDFMREFIVKSATDIKPNQETGVVPFRLDSQTENEPSEFEMHFIQKKIRYQYGFILDRKKVYEEWLVAYPTGLPQRWFTRKWNPEKNEYEWKFSNNLKGEKESLKQKTKDNSLFLSIAAQFNQQQLTNVYDWFDEHLHAIDFLSSEYPLLAAMKITGINELHKMFMKDNLTNADLGIVDINVQHLRIEDVQFPPGTSDEWKEKMLIENKGKDILKTDFFHSKSGSPDPVSLDLYDESTGTLKYFSLQGFCLANLVCGCTLFIDEMGTYLHPLLFRNVLMSINSNINLIGAQWIFTTYDTTQLNSDTLRRDQIWFTEKNDEGATILYPLTDFKPRVDESLQKGYLAGRYGAIPFLGEFKF